MAIKSDPVAPRNSNFNFDRMQKVFAIVVLLCCAVLMGRANEAPPAWVNAVDTNAMERVLLSQWGQSPMVGLNNL